MAKITHIENIGFTKGGIQEVCRWKGSIPCPRHKKHGVLKLDSTEIKNLTVFENPQEPASNMSLEWYLKSTEEKPEDRDGYAETLDDLTNYEKYQLDSYGKVQVDDTWYISPDGEWLEETRVIQSQDDLTDIELEELNDMGFINIDGVGYFFNNDGDFRISENEHGQILGLKDRLIRDLDKDFIKYVDENANKGETLNLEVEQWFMTGGCGVYALKLQELNPSYQIAVDKYWCEGEDLYNHVFCVDPETNRAYDSRGEFESPEALMDYKTDPHSGISPSSGEDDYDDFNELSDMFEDDGYIFWSRQQADHMVGAGTFTFVTDDTDQHYIEKLITGFKPRYSL
jgi:hypothetical protein